MMHIHSVGNGKQFLTREQLQPLHSLWSESPAPKASQKYRQVKTVDIINIFADQGWLPVTAQEQRVNKDARDGFQKHLVRFRNTSLNSPSVVGDTIPEIVLRNSHDTTTTYQLMAGIFRMICLNGCVVSEAEFGTIKIRHMGFEPSQIVDATRKFSEEIPQVMGRVKDYQAIDLTLDERNVFAQSALLLKANPDEDEKIYKDGNVFTIGKRQFDVPKLLEYRRPQDAAPTLWNTYNTIQEKLTKGNRYEVNTEDHSFRPIYKKVREIKGIDESVRVNRGLWHLMSEMAKIKGASVYASA